MDKLKKDKLKKVTNFMFEIGTLKNVKRSGFWLINIKDPESVADHSFRTGILGYILAQLEGANPEKVALMCLFNDLHEARLNDLHKIGQRYIDFKKAETVAHKEQTESIGELGEGIFSLHRELHELKTKEADVARDADLLENAYQAKEYIEIGHKDAQNWIDNIRGVIKTKTAKKLLDLLEKTNSNDWWQSLKKIER
jgi:putative hydrolase of HD superfamily